MHDLVHDLATLLGGEFYFRTEELGKETKIGTKTRHSSFNEFSDPVLENYDGLVAFSEHGLMIRWWSLGSFWWEKLSRNFVPVQCTKLIFVPPWEGFSPNPSRSSIMASILDTEKQLNLQDNMNDSNHGDSLKQLLHNLDLSYRLEWVAERKVLLTTHGNELGTFQL
ncbi:hypothetical protein KIW84_070811 [Lathyrus oleraceus]|uniref:Uncharacterized protein n=1 Tax=Pisum sativum TaxID=3888 RepID=A0A9D4VJ13_PEA|nr:hypothetical protein KIW84_070811 [Pisum sativum]